MCTNPFSAHPDQIGSSHHVLLFIGFDVNGLQPQLTSTSTHLSAWYTDGQETAQSLHSNIIS